MSSSDSSYYGIKKRLEKDPPVEGLPRQHQYVPCMSPGTGHEFRLWGMPCVQADRQDTGATEYSRPPRAYQRTFWLPPASKARLPCVAKPFTTGFHVVLHSLYITPRRSRS